MTLTIRKIDPLTMGDQVKALFASNERPEFPAYFDRAYPMAVREGGVGWVSLDQGGAVVGFTGGFVTRLSVRGQEVRGMLLVNLMIDKAHRTFFPGVSLLKRAVRDAREGGAAFVYTNPNNPGSVATSRAAGLPHIGDRNRFLLPVGHANPAVDLALAVRQGALQLLRPRLVAEPAEVAETVRWTTEERCEVGPVSPRRMRTLYPLRLEGFGGGQDLGVAIRDAKGGQVAAALVRIPPDGDDASLVTLRCRRADVVAGAAAALGRLLRSRGVRRLNASAMVGSRFGRELERGGLFCRKEPMTVVALGFTDAGREAVAGLAGSDIEAIDMD